jgi:endonuclease/exonuclease/phosphatase family metal-dependent hydrolase
MQIRVSGRNSRLFLRAVAGVVFSGAATLASAQTTVTLNQPATQVWTATVRGGSYATQNERSVLATRASDNLEYRRRAFLKFDTQNTIPAGSGVTSALLTLTVKMGSEDSTRAIGAYQVTTSWDEAEITWTNRRSGTAWRTPGGDLGSKIDDATVGNVAGTKVTFDVTPLVKEAVAGRLGTSRYTRIALVDLEGSTSASYREYFLPSDPNTAVRPVLKVTYGTSTTSTTTSTSSVTSSTSTSTAGKVLRVLQWNISKNGWGTDGKYSPSRIASWAVKLNPDIISFNEVEKWNQYSLGEDGVALYKGLLESKTGVRWYVWEAQAYGEWYDKGLHNVVFSKFPFVSNYRTAYSAGKLRTVGGATVPFNGRTINFMSTHFDPYYSSYRLTQAKDLIYYAKGFAEDRIICGDFNDQPTDPPITTMTALYYDAWAEGKKAGIATASPDNTAGNTRNSRIDYIFYSRQEQHLTLKKVQVVDTRDANGVMPSDHRPVLAEFLVQ